MAHEIFGEVVLTRQTAINGEKRVKDYFKRDISKQSSGRGERHGKKKAAGEGGITRVCNYLKSAAKMRVKVCGRGEVKTY